MCGFIFTSKKNIDRTHWHKSMEPIICRGPDFQKTISGEYGTAGHARLKIIGLDPDSNQPFTNSNNKKILLFNGEIYNYKELGKKYSIDAKSDTHVLFELLNRNLYESMSELRGMFAFVFINNYEHKITTVRDFFGIKPLYYYQDQGEIFFSSMVSGIIPLINKIQIDQESKVGFLASGLFHGSKTIIKNLKKQEIGTIMQWTKSQDGWISSTQKLKIKQTNNLSVSDALKSSIDRHLVSDVPVGVLLSGGVDSTLIAALASKKVNNLKTFSLTNPNNPKIDESFYARHNAKILNTDHHEIAYDINIVKENILQLLKFSGEPFGDAANIPLSILCGGVKKYLNCVLAGEGSDEIFGGYKRYDVEKYKYQNLDTILDLLSALNIKKLFSGQNQNLKIIRTLNALLERNQYLSHSNLLFSEWESMLQIDDKSSKEALRYIFDRWIADTEVSDFFHPNRTYDLFEWLPNVLLEKSDRASMLHGIEVRVPFLDLELFNSNYPKNPKNTRKEVLREILKQEFPNIKLPDKKMGLSVDIKELVMGVLKNDLAEGIRKFSGSENHLRIKNRVLNNPTFGFRIAILELWEQTWN